MVLIAVDDYPDPPGRLPSSESARRFGALLAGGRGGTVLDSVVATSEHEVIDARTLPAVRLPNRDGFVPDPRPDVGKLAKPPKR